MPAGAASSSSDGPSLRGRVALVTGAAAGIGLACVRRLLGDGCRVAMLDRDGDALDLATSDLAAGDSQAAERVLARVGDATAEDVATGLVDDAVHRWGRLDLLVNAAGGFTDATAFEDLDVDEFRRALDLNLTSAFLATRAAVRIMRPAGYGRIVNIASMAGRTAVPATSHPYSAAKAGMIGMTRRLAFELAPHGITVNAVAPGVVLSPRVAQVHASRLPEILSATPVGRTGEPEEIADAVWYLSRPESGYVTGAVIDVNGGRFMG